MTDAQVHSFWILCPDADPERGDTFALSADKVTCENCKSQMKNDPFAIEYEAAKEKKDNGMKKLLPCKNCKIETVQTVISNGHSVCWCGTENESLTVNPLGDDEAKLKRLDTDTVRTEGTK